MRTKNRRMQQSDPSAAEMCTEILTNFLYYQDCKPGRWINLAWCHHSKRQWDESWGPVHVGSFCRGRSRHCRLGLSCRRLWTYQARAAVLATGCLLARGSLCFCPTLSVTTRLHSRPRHPILKCRLQHLVKLAPGRKWASIWNRWHELVAPGAMLDPCTTLEGTCCGSAARDAV